MAAVPPVTSRLLRLVSVFLGILFSATACREEPTAPGADTPATPNPALSASASALSFSQLSGMWNTCGVTTGHSVYCWGGVPSLRAAGLQFLQVREGTDFVCGLTTTNRVYCWGFNQLGQLGNGSSETSSEVPVELAGGRRYKQLRVGDSHGCATTVGGVSYCWGLNSNGQLGDGTTITRRSPVRIASNVTFLVVSTGRYHTCALSSAKKAYCWGRNDVGQLGIRNSITQLKPVPVADGRTFSVVTAGGFHTCGLAPDDKGYCWGWNKYGQLGDGTTSRRSRPTLVAGGLTFTSLNPGGSHTCGLTPNHAAYCWGYNWYGQVGDGTSADTQPFVSMRLAPTAVTGGLLFDKIMPAMASMHTCGITTDNRAYCWGSNAVGQLGIGGTSWSSTTPTAVVGAE
jgi:alpha-tubulin suppressor-like RCC1 family protein